MEKNGKDQLDREYIKHGGTWRVGESRTIVYIIARRKTNWVGHVMRGNGMLREATEGTVWGEKGPGRQ